eukprot:6178414-Pleurochrysis_carterae.AAC.5
MHGARERGFRPCCLFPVSSTLTNPDAVEGSSAARSRRLDLDATWRVDARGRCLRRFGAPCVAAATETWQQL